jgi:protein-S-isoprenylcysteine O-methyltransferase Ste14
VQRRMQGREKIPQQQWIMRGAAMLSIFGLALAGWDHRMGWTRKFFGGIPAWVQIVAQIVTFVTYVEAMLVLDVNRFASRTIQVEEHQPVISNGPYRVVRHPMYAFVLVMWLAVGPALGSLVAVPIFTLFLPVLVLRLLNEESVLRRDLPGYVQYCQGTRYRLVPYLW